MNNTQPDAEVYTKEVVSKIFNTRRLEYDCSSYVLVGASRRSMRMWAMFGFVGGGEGV